MCCIQLSLEQHEYLLMGVIVQVLKSGSGIKCLQNILSVCGLWYDTAFNRPAFRRQIKRCECHFKIFYHVSCTSAYYVNIPSSV